MSFYRDPWARDPLGYTRAWAMARWASPPGASHRAKDPERRYPPTGWRVVRLPVKTQSGHYRGSWNPDRIVLEPLPLPRMFASRPPAALPRARQTGVKLRERVRWAA